MQANAAYMQHTFALPCCGLAVKANADSVISIAFAPHPTASAALPQHALLQQFAQELTAYLDNPQHTFTLPYTLTGTPHQQQVWRAIAQIRAGQTSNYQAIAENIGSSARAVGTACGRNPLPILIPCHRIIKKNGTLGGFNQKSTEGDLHTKQWLLAHERALAAVETRQNGILASDVYIKNPQTM